MSREKFLKRIQMRILPPSSRSYQSGQAELKYSQAEIKYSQAELKKKLEYLEEKNKYLEEKVENLLNGNDQLKYEMQKMQEMLKHDLEEKRHFHDDLLYNICVNRKHLQLYAESLYKKENEEIRSARIRFFSQLPETSGISRLYQQVNTKLMSILDSICKKHGLSYWFAYGSLLGAYTRQSAVPWDDDIDICMMRSDINKLKEILKEDEKCQLTLVYDYGVKVKQYRFSLKDPDILNFIDVCCWEWVSEANQENEEILRKLRYDLMKEIEESDDFDYWKERNYLFAPGSGYVVQWYEIDYNSQDADKTKTESERIERIYECYQQKAVELGVFCDEKEAKAVAYGLGNMLSPAERPLIYSRNSIFPTRRIEYEGIQVDCPADISGFLNSSYIDWPYLPQDILGGHDHFEKRLLQEEKIKKAMSNFLEDAVLEENTK